MIDHNDKGKAIAPLSDPSSSQANDSSSSFGGAENQTLQAISDLPESSVTLDQVYQAILDLALNLAAFREEAFEFMDVRSSGVEIVHNDLTLGDKDLQLYKLDGKYT